MTNAWWISGAPLVAITDDRLSAVVYLYGFSKVTLTWVIKQSTGVRDSHFPLEHILIMYKSRLDCNTCSLASPGAEKTSLQECLLPRRAGTTAARRTFIALFCLLLGSTIAHLRTDGCVSIKCSLKLSTPCYIVLKIMVTDFHCLFHKQQCCGQLQSLCMKSGCTTQSYSLRSC